MDMNAFNFGILRENWYNSLFDICSRSKIFMISAKLSWFCRIISKSLQTKSSKFLPNCMIAFIFVYNLCYLKIFEELKDWRNFIRMSDLLKTYSSYPSFPYRFKLKTLSAVDPISSTKSVFYRNSYYISVLILQNASRNVLN